MDALEDIGGVFNELVNQFSDPLAFFRELIQNSIDAGSQQIEIWFEVTPTGGDDVVLVMHVDDFGEGMTREIIENKLTRLFSSTKDDDFTKIGRFGIGFVSVFSIAPDAVVLDTARAGETWRVIFHPDRTYDLISLEEPVEGTQIRVVKSMSKEGASELVERAGEAIGTWCKHAAVPIIVEGKDVRAAFDLESDCKIFYEEEGTRVVVAFVDGPTTFGFYNRGLTLLEGHERWWPNVSFKIDSRYLEHTLTRDRVIEDRHFHRAKALLEDLATERLPAHLFDLLEAAAAEQAEVYLSLIAHVRKGVLGGTIDWAKQGAGRRVLPMVVGDPISSRLARKHLRSGDLFLCRGGGHMASTSVHLIGTLPTVGFCDFVKYVVGTDVPFIEDHFAQAVLLEEGDLPGANELLSALDRLAKDVLGGVPRFVLGDLRYRGSPFHDWAAAVVPSLGVVSVSNVEVPTEDALSIAEFVVVNAFEPGVVACIGLASMEPELAALELCKRILLPGGLSEAFIERSARWVLKSRGEP